MSLPAKFAFLAAPDAPRLVAEAVKLLGTIETAGPGNTTKIVAWADEVAALCPSSYAKWAADFYNADSIAWCGLFVAVCAARSANGKADRYPPDRYLAALSWASWGKLVPKEEAVVGDVMVMTRTGGGHVTINAGTIEGGRQFFGIGGNQGDAVTIAPFNLERVTTVRRPSYTIAPAGAQRVILPLSGRVGGSEA